MIVFSLAIIVFAQLGKWEEMSQRSHMTHILSTAIEADLSLHLKLSFYTKTENALQTYIS